MVCRVTELLSCLAAQILQCFAKEITNTITRGGNTVNKSFLRYSTKKKNETNREPSKNYVRTKQNLSSFKYNCDLPRENGQLVAKIIVFL